MYRRILKLSILASLLVMAAGIFYAKLPFQNISVRSAFSSIIPQAQHARGGIEGRVIDDKGQPIANAKVFAEGEDTTKSLVMTGMTDKDGNFKIDVPEPGTYLVYGSKEEDNYALTISGFHQEFDVHNPVVTVAQNQVARDVILQFGPKSSKIDGVIIDAISNRPVTKATITLRRTDNPEIYYMIGAAGEKENGRFKVLVPPLPFTIEVSSPQYDTWTYSNNGLKNRSDSLVVNRGEVKKLQIGLHPQKQPK